MFKCSVGGVGGVTVLLFQCWSLVRVVVQVRTRSPVDFSSRRIAFEAFKRSAVFSSSSDRHCKGRHAPHRLLDKVLFYRSLACLADPKDAESAAGIATSPRPKGESEAIATAS